MKDEELRLTKIEVAERQLCLAVRLFYSEEDIVSIETLTAAACGVLRGLGSIYGVKRILHDAEIIKAEHRKEWIKILHAPQNFFKHADRDPDETIAYKVASVQHMFLDACRLYWGICLHKDVRRKLCAEPIAFELWFCLKYPQLLLNPDDIKKILPNSFDKMNPHDLKSFRVAIESMKTKT
jgi:hypothetical protein